MGSYVSHSFSSEVDGWILFVAESQVGDSCCAWYRYAFSQQLFTVDMFSLAVLFAYMQSILQKYRPLTEAAKTLLCMGATLIIGKWGVYVCQQDLKHDLDLLLIMGLCIDS